MIFFQDLFVFFLSISLNYSSSLLIPNNSIILINPTYLGNYQRNYYGNELPDSLNLIWKIYLGEGETEISRKIGKKKWKGAGWTGQPLLIKENDTLFIIQGAFDHHLKKIYAHNGKIKWQYKFDDVIKGTGTIWKNPVSDSLVNKYIIMQGSRLGLGNYLDSKHIPSYRAISYMTGKEIWRLDVKLTDSYSRDVDGSALCIDSLIYIGLENSLFTVIDPDPKKTLLIDSMKQPKIISEHKLYTANDVENHKNNKEATHANVVIESSSVFLKDHIYIASGSGHIYGYNIKTDSIDWDFFIGSDIDGTPVVTNDSSIIVTIEKQYIKGKGGTLKLNPRKKPGDALEWFFPVGNKEYNSWLGGIIGSASINDHYIKGNDSIPKLAVFTGIDGYLYVIKHNQTIKDSLVLSFDSTSMVKIPEIIFKKKIGPSISTPIIVKDKILACSYNGIFLFSFDKNLNFKLLCSKPDYIEATPFCYNRKIYIASRNGYFYCLGD